MKKFLTIIFVLIALNMFAESAVIIDYNTPLIDNVQRSSFLNIFSDEVIKSQDYSLQIIQDDKLESYWNNKQALIEKCDSLHPDKIIIFKYYILGDNFTLRFQILDVNTNSFIRNEEFVLKEPEELKIVAKKAALILTENKSIEELSSIGLVTKTEQNEALENRRQGLSVGAYSIGYIYANKSVIDDTLYAGKYDQAIMVGVTGGIEISKYSRMDINFDFVLLGSMAASIGYTRTFSDYDFTPYLGGDLGIEYAFGRKDLYPASSIGGILLRPKMGIIMMNTYQYSFYIEPAYRLVINDFNDSAFELRIGVISRSSGGNCLTFY